MIARGIQAFAKTVEVLRTGRRTCLAMAMLALVAEPAFAQVQTVTAPLFPAVDAQGVDSVTGAYWTSVAEVTIGRPGDGGLVHGRTWINTGWRDWLAGTINSSGSKYAVSVGAHTEAFTLSSGTYLSDQHVGSTLTYDSGTSKYTYTSADGTVFVFNKALATAGSTTNFWSSNEGAIETITRPLGEVTSYTYTAATVAGVTGIRPKSVTTNFGYQIHFTYAVDVPTTAADVTGGYLNRTKATGINRAFYYCADNSNTCSDVTGGKWPYVVYSNSPTPACWSSGAFECTVDRLGNKTMYSFVSSARTQMQGWIPPTVAALATPFVVNQVNYFTSGVHAGKVSGVTMASGGGAWGYTYSDAGGVRTTNTLSGLSVAIIAKSDIAAGWATEVWGDSSGNHKTVLHRDAYGRVDRVTTADDDTGALDPYVEYTFDGRGNVTQSSAVAKPSTRPTITTYASYDVTCTNAKTCNQPNSVTDAIGNVTNFTYDPTHGGVTKVTSPSAVGAGIRPETRFSYTSLSAYYLNSGGSLSAGSTVYLVTGQSVCVAGAASGAGCAAASDEIKRTISYGAASVPNNRLPISITEGSGSGALSVLLSTATYSVTGDLTRIDGPLSGTGDAVNYYYDEIRRLRATAINTPNGANSRITRTTYNADGNAILSEVVVDNSANWETSTASLQKTASQYSTGGKPVFSKIDGRSTVGSSFQTFAITEQGYDVDFRFSCSALRMNPATYSGAVPSGTVCNQWTNGTYGPDRITSPGFNAYNQASLVSSGIGTPLQRNDVVRTYTTSGLLASEADAKGNTTNYAYDGFNRLVQVRYPGSSSNCSGTTRDCVDFSYDNYSRLIGKTGRDGQSFSYAYDNLGRMATYTPPSGQPAITYSYDNLGRVTQASILGNTTSYSYDALNRLTSETQNGQTVGYQYDDAGRRTRLTWPDGYYVTYEYTDTGELLKIKENGSALASAQLATYTYDDLGRTTSLTRANGSTTAYTYDAVSRLTVLDHNLGGAATTNDLQIGLAYSPASQIVGRTVSNSSYLLTAPSPYTDSYTTNALNQYASITGVTPSPTYDKRGNMTNDGTKAYTYDFDNKMLSAGATTLTYDPAGRLFRIVGGTTRGFLYDGTDIIAEIDLSGNVLRRYVHGLGVDEPIVRYDGSSTGTKNQLYADERGSIVATEGASTYRYKYDEYGVPAASQSDLFQYTGQAWIPETGLFYYKARFYNAEIGRFMQADPIGYRDGMNLYNYGASDPTNRTDPTGLDTCFEFTWTESHFRSDNTLEVDGYSGEVCFQIGDFTFNWNLGLIEDADDFACALPTFEGNPGDYKMSPAEQAASKMLGAAIASALEGAGNIGTKTVAGLASFLMLSSDTHHDPEEPDQFVVRAGVATPGSIMKGSGPVTGYPGITGFSTASAPGMTWQQLAAASRFPNAKVSVSTVRKLAMVGVPVIPTKTGAPNHATAVVQTPVDPAMALAISLAFEQQDNPSRGCSKR